MPGHRLRRPHGGTRIHRRAQPFRYSGAGEPARKNIARRDRGGGGELRIFGLPVFGRPAASRQYANGIFRGGDGWGWPSAVAYLAAVAHHARLATVASLVGHGSLRVALFGYEQRALEPAEMDRLEQTLSDALTDGAAGFSTGLMYAPGSGAPFDELLRLCRVVAKHDRIYTTHTRSTCRRFTASATVVSNRTRLISQMRAFCLEYGVAIRQGAGVFRLDLPRVLANETNDLTRDDAADADRALRGFAAARSADRRRDPGDRGTRRPRRSCAPADDRSRHRTARRQPRCSLHGDGRQFRRARDLAAWLGLVPREHSTGGKTTLLGHQQARQPLRPATTDPWRALLRDAPRPGAGPARRLARRLAERMHVNKVTVALAAKIARIAWVILTKPGALYERRDPAVA